MRFYCSVYYRGGFRTRLVSDGLRACLRRLLGDSGLSDASSRGPKGACLQLLIEGEACEAMFKGLDRAARSCVDTSK